MHSLRTSDKWLIILGSCVVFAFIVFAGLVINQSNRPASGPHKVVIFRGGPGQDCHPLTKYRVTFDCGDDQIVAVEP